MNVDVHHWYRGYWNFNKRVPKRVIFDTVHSAHKDPEGEGRQTSPRRRLPRNRLNDQTGRRSRMRVLGWGFSRDGRRAGRSSAPVGCATTAQKRFDGLRLGVSCAARITISIALTFGAGRTRPDNTHRCQCSGHERRRFEYGPWRSRRKATLESPQPPLARGGREGLIALPVQKNAHELFGPRATTNSVFNSAWICLIQTEFFSGVQTTEHLAAVLRSVGPTPDCTRECRLGAPPPVHPLFYPHLR